jgi:hypothetical protein
LVTDPLLGASKRWVSCEYNCSSMIYVSRRWPVKFRVYGTLVARPRVFAAGPVGLALAAESLVGSTRRPSSSGDRAPLS